MTFTVKEYRLEYAVWAAYRAAQAGSSKAKGRELSSALRQSGIIEYIDEYKGAEVEQDDFDNKHKDWCKSIIKHVKENYSKDITYGIASKLVGVFLKGYYILAGNHEKPLAKVIHPPIDSYLLKGIDSEKKSTLASDYKWQKLDEKKYFELVDKLKYYVDKTEQFWRIEKYWKLK